ncbi:hypothetical protein ABGB12_01410 [Actinocorallia sp. B10E7]|uniref:hypothetical protein n=1 Tax=Actinocorallia sp. B10E7 TaxID=3153558 RepID=UPI00325D5D77
MSRVLRAQFIEAVIGLVITTLLSSLGDAATLLGLTGTGLVMALTAFMTESGGAVLAVLALLFPFLSAEALERSLGRPLAAIVNNESGNGETTLTQIYDKYKGDKEGNPPSVKVPPTIDQEARASVHPASLTLDCFGKDCRREVTVQSTGTSKLRLSWSEFTGPGRAAWHYSDDCEKENIDPGDSCTFRVWADETAYPDARLVIHDNTPNPASQVALTVGGSTPPPEEQGTLVAQGSTGINPATCDALDGSVTVLASNGPVEWNAASDDGAGDVAISPPSGSIPSGQTQTISVRGSHPGPGFTFTVSNIHSSVGFQVIC